MRARVGLITVTLTLPGTASLKEKRSRLRPVIEGLRSRFKVAVAEVGEQDIWDRAVIAAAAVAGDAAFLDRVMANLAAQLERYDVRVEKIETEVI